MSRGKLRVCLSIFSDYASGLLLLTLFVELNLIQRIELIGRLLPHEALFAQVQLSGFALSKPITGVGLEARAVVTAHVSFGTGVGGQVRKGGVVNWREP